MLSYYCLKCRRNTESINLEVAKTKNGKVMLFSKYAVCDSRKLKFPKEQEATGLLSSLVSKIPLVGPLFF